jgi:uncharacterized protein (DUF488 family)
LHSPQTIKPFCIRFKYIVPEDSFLLSLEDRISDLFNISTANKVVKAYEKGEIKKNQRALEKAYEFGTSV